MCNIAVLKSQKNLKKKKSWGKKFILKNNKFKFIKKINKSNKINNSIKKIIFDIYNFF